MTLTPGLSLFDVFEKYFDFLRTQEKSDANERMLTSVLVRFFVPAVDGPSPKGLRATPTEVFAALNHLKVLPSHKAADILAIAESEFEAKNVEKNNRRKFRNYLKQFADWAKANCYCEKVEGEQKVEHSRLHAPAGQAKRDWHGNMARYEQPLKKTYQLGAKCFPDDYFNTKLLADIEAFRKFRSAELQCSAATLKKESQKLNQILGWLHRYKEIPLEELRLSSIIFFIPLNVKIQDFGSDYTSYLIKKAQRRDEAVQLTKDNIQLIQDYLDFLGGHPSSSVIYLTLIIAIAKFSYKGEIGTDEYRDYNDVPIVKELKKLQSSLVKKAKSTPPSVPTEKKVVPWAEAIRVMEAARLRAEKELTHSMTKKGLQERKRTDYALQRDLQDFLSIAFMVLMPPDRSRTYCELELGETMLQGIFDGPRFIPAEEMSDPSKALWFIRLEPDQYKTGKAYKTNYIPITNFHWEDGKTLYGYINHWLTWGREWNEELNHQFFFRGTITNRPLTSKDWLSRIRYIFDRESNVAVAPKELRKMYVSHIKEEGVTEEIADSSAAAMRHSRKTQGQIYDARSHIQKVSPALKYAEKLAQRVLREKNNSNQ